MELPTELHEVQVEEGQGIGGIQGGIQPQTRVKTQTWKPRSLPTSPALLNPVRDSNNSRNKDNSQLSSAKLYSTNFACLLI